MYTCMQDQELEAPLRMIKQSKMKLLFLNIIVRSFNFKYSTGSYMLLVSLSLNG